MIDSHCHLDFACFDDDRQSILAQCRLSHISKIVIPGTQATSWPQLISLCQSSSQLVFALGLHPYFLQDDHEQDFVLLEELLTRHRGDVVAVGEMGLDNSLQHKAGLQEDVFNQQLSLANTYQLPIIVHHRRSHNQLIRLLKAKLPSKGGIVHAFSGSLFEAQTYIDMGFKLGVGGTITYARAAKTRDVIRQVPLSSLVLETDAPDMPLQGKQGQRNSPLNLPLVLMALQDLRRESKAEVAQVCRQNTLDILEMG